tara:strand:+ start:189 stop:851 length:663 start_codon:yes stop_codon:yes gene_type:complete
MSYLLNIETSTTNCSVSLSFENDLIDCIEQDSLNYSHSENLHVFINELLNKNSTKFNKLSAISVSRGPGSYTGLRIGLSAAKGLCYGLDIPLISISSLKILANSIKFDGFIVSTMDARRDEVYSCIYDSNLNVISEEKPEIINHESFIDVSKNNKLLFIGDGQFKCKELINTNANFSFEGSILRPTSKNMIDLAFGKFKNSDFEDLAYFEPKYLKKFRTN